MTQEEQISVNGGVDIFSAPHPIRETNREALSQVEEKTDKDIYAQD